jgi:hypothetical protein
MGDGSTIRFWHDQWCGDVALKEAFPTLFRIARAKNASVASSLEFFGGSNQWNVSFARTADDWEVDVFASFLQVLHSARVRRGIEDKLWWVPSKKGLFKVKSFYRSLGCTEGCRFPWKSVWQTQAPLRAAFFAWSAVLGKILTLDNLKKRHVLVMDRFACIRGMGSPWTTFFFFVTWLMPFALPFQSFWFVLGYAQTCSQAVYLLVDLWQSAECYSVEDGAYVPFMVFMEDKE